ncbi:Sulfurtransferase TusE [Buchnera aphidicola (Cinara cuneomaculata)]|uniref:Sulfurtransferase n=1 Tax=Buchnera aphidicola (Cinara cuneomaculata) TaxID=1660040 RepID=A0A451CY58_9GAMM|nr:TusE/DsrC/DsvC family sulfur relay protein [Buchnera aphidicola]VFP78274.1 Sulfurtransferase TusE [Buchnera aphidicola (Cinara cuneomaculata)]
MNNWNIQSAKYIAKKLNITLNKKHWKIIFCMRNFYKKYNFTPSTRIFLKYMKKQNISLTSQDLFILFPNGFMKYASQISGIPRNNNCF